jgi:hypothetical protein
MIADLETLSDGDGDGREEVETEIVQMDLVGISPQLGQVQIRRRPPGAPPEKPTQGKIEEDSNSTPGVLDVPPFARAGTATSFFYVFFEIEPATAGPVLHNDGEHPIPLEGMISEKPVAPGESFEFDGLGSDPVPLVDEDGEPGDMEVALLSLTPTPLDDLPDLIILDAKKKGLSAPRTVKRGDKLPVRYTAKNIGKEEAPRTFISIVLSPDMPYGNGDDVLRAAVDGIPRLKPNNVFAGSEKFTVPPATAVGNYHVCAYVDHVDTRGGAAVTIEDHPIDESDETNNDLCTTRTVSVE